VVTQNSQRLNQARDNSGYFIRHMSPFMTEDETQNTQLMTHLKNIQDARAGGGGAQESVQAVAGHLAPHWQQIQGEDVNRYQSNAWDSQMLQDYQAMSSYKSRGTEMLEMFRSFPELRATMGVSDEQFDAQRTKNGFVAGVQKMAENRVRHMADPTDVTRATLRDSNTRTQEHLLLGQKNFRSFQREKRRRAGNP
jgi:hypothetical protein